jgi:hypothetical protein
MDPKYGPLFHVALALASLRLMLTTSTSQTCAPPSLKSTVLSPTPA